MGFNSSSPDSKPSTTKTYQRVHNLDAGLNTIAHNFNLNYPYPVDVEFVDATTKLPIKGNLVVGDPLPFPVVRSDANSVTIFCSKIVRNVQITIIG